MADQFASYAAGLSSPLIGALGEITPHDTNELNQVTREIYVTTAGNLAITWIDGTETIEPVAQGERLPWRAKRIKATGTTAVVRGFY